MEKEIRDIHKKLSTYHDYFKNHIINRVIISKQKKIFTEKRTNAI